jgi:glycosyltransferase involved in cell wall biosynthesis
VLVIDNALPRPDRDAGSVATFEQMLLLRRLGYRVAFAPTGDDEDVPAEKAALRRNGIEVAGPPAYDSITAYLEAHGAGLDLVHIYRHANATMFFDRVRARAPQAKLLFAPADLHHLREARAAELTGTASLGPAGTREAELACIRASDATIITSDHEMALLHDDVPAGKLKLLRWIAHARPASPGFAARAGLCFLGSFGHPPNADAVHWFAAEVLPLVLRTLPDLRLSIAGANPPESIRALDSANVEVLGWVADLEALFGRVRLSVAPLRYGAGFKGKVATSLAHGVPVVGTAIALEGTGLAPGDGIALADDPAAFAAEVVRLHEDEAVWNALAGRGVQRCRELYSPEAATEVYRRLLTDLGLPVSGG